PGDGGLWLVLYNTGSIGLLQFTGNYVWVEGLDFAPGAVTNISSLTISGIMTRAIRCRAKNRNGNAAYGNTFGCDLEMNSSGSHRIDFAGGNNYPITVTKTRI